MLAAALCVSLWSAEAAVDEPVAVFVHESDLDDRRRALLERLTADEIDKLDGRTARLASAATGASPCAEGGTCLGRLAAALGASEVVTVSVSRVGDTEVLTLRRTSLVDGTILADSTMSVAAADGSLTLLGDAVAQLFPRAPRLPGALPGVAPEISARWNPAPLPRWAFFATAGTATAAAAAGLGFLLQAHADADAYRALGESDQLVEGARLMGLYRSAATNKDVSYGLLSAAGTLAAAAVVMGVFTDWGDDAVLTPLLGPGSAGAAFVTGF